MRLSLVLLTLFSLSAFTANIADGQTDSAATLSVVQTPVFSAAISESNDPVATPAPVDKILISGNSVVFPPLTRGLVDYLFDSLRSSGAYNPPALELSDQVDANTRGIWAGSKSSMKSELGAVVLRFRPSAEARLARAAQGAGLPMLAEYFDVRLELTPSDFVITHTLARDSMIRAGIRAPIPLKNRDRTRTEFVHGVRDSSMYFSFPGFTRDEAENAWALLVCPRVYSLQPNKPGVSKRLDLNPSPYELVDVNFTFSAESSARMTSATKPQSLEVQMSLSSQMPPSEGLFESVKSVLPLVEMPYRPNKAFSFARFPIQEGSMREGIVTSFKMTNPAGYQHQQYFSHILYVQKMQEPSPVSVIVGSLLATKDEGDCYIVATQRSFWSRYGKEAPI